MVQTGKTSARADPDITLDIFQQAVNAVAGEAIDGVTVVKMPEGPGLFIQQVQPLIIRSDP